MEKLLIKVCQTGEGEGMERTHFSATAQRPSLLDTGQDLGCIFLELTKAKAKGIIAWPWMIMKFIGSTGPVIVLHKSLTSYMEHCSNWQCQDVHWQQMHVCALCPGMQGHEKHIWGQCWHRRCEVHPLFQYTITVAF